MLIRPVESVHPRSTPTSSLPKDGWDRWERRAVMEVMGGGARIRPAREGLQGFDEDVEGGLGLRWCEGAGQGAQDQTVHGGGEDAGLLCDVVG